MSFMHQQDINTRLNICLESLKEEFELLVQRIRILGNAALVDYERKLSLPEIEFMHLYEETKSVWCSILLYYFNIEERALFPILMEKGFSQDVLRLMEGHKKILDTFASFEIASVYDEAVRLLREIVNMLKNYMSMEDELLQKTQDMFTREELERVDRIVKFLVS